MLQWKILTLNPHALLLRAVVYRDLVRAADFFESEAIGSHPRNGLDQEKILCLSSRRHPGKSTRCPDAQQCERKKQSRGFVNWPADFFLTGLHSRELGIKNEGDCQFRR